MSKLSLGVAKASRVAAVTPPDLAAVANREHALVESGKEAVVQHAIFAGLALAEAKAGMAHGEWVPWLKANFDGGLRSARIYMKLAKVQRAALLDASSIRQALAAISSANRQDVARERTPEAAGDVPPPEGRFRCLVIDPPWPMEKIEREVAPDQGVTLDYPVMSLEDIEALPVPSLLDEAGAHVYLWVTHRFLPAGLDLFEAWGVRYQCLMTWVKNVGFTPYSWMYSTEHVLFGRVGSLDLLKNGMRLDFAAPRTVHSAKPDVFYQRVIAASPGPRLEMFARTRRDGFEAWGNEVTDAT